LVFPPSQLSHPADSVCPSTWLTKRHSNEGVGRMNGFVPDAGTTQSGLAASFPCGPADSQGAGTQSRKAVSTQRNAKSANSEINGGSPHKPVSCFHLLSERDVKELQRLSETILHQGTSIIRDWHQQYVLHFGNSRTLLEAEFTSLFEDALQRTHSALLTGDLDKCASEVRQLGESLLQRGLPTDELIALFQLLNNSVRRIVTQAWRGPEPAVTAFNRFSYVQIGLLVCTYFCSHKANLKKKARPEVAATPAPKKASFHGLVGATSGMRRLYYEIEAVAGSRGNLLIAGESGTGKELVARAVHNCSSRAQGPFVALNCAALPKDLIESELFGYKRGAFSSATHEYPGLFRAADGGTLFLDEITEMSPATQSKLLRAVQDRAIRPIGLAREHPVDVRLIASTNRDPEIAMAHGYLRQDLYYRLQATVITIPPLRKRREDIPLLVDHFICMFNQSFGRTVSGVERQTMAQLLQYDWPGNVRELSNAVEGAFTFGKSPLISLDDLPPAVISANPPVTSPSRNGATGCEDAPVGTFADMERALIAQALKNNGGNKVHTAEQLKISRRKLYAKIARYGLSV
jgi:DNA-binding NtrC family response regulator